MSSSSAGAGAGRGAVGWVAGGVKEGTKLVAGACTGGGLEAPGCLFSSTTGGGAVSSLCEYLFSTSVEWEVGSCGIGITVLQSALVDT